LKNSALKKYAESNIPVRFWMLDMKNVFKGDENLFEKYEEIVFDLKKTYNDGICICFAGGHGVGKTLASTSVLKRAVEKGYNSLYVTLSDVVENLISSQSSEKSIMRQELLKADFLVIDEFDPRYMPSDAASDLYGRTLENIFRTRVQNALPTFMCTNSPNVVESFTGSIKQSIDSLMSYTKIVHVLGSDYRKQSLKQK
jgi:DNA replication protein DnaC